MDNIKNRVSQIGQCQKYSIVKARKNAHISARILAESFRKNWQRFGYLNKTI